MIVRELPDGSAQLITQPDHANVARTIMERAAPLADHPRRGSILLAIAEHDNGWREEDAAPIVRPGTGRIADFMTVPVEVRHRVWPRGVGRLADSWSAALVAHHAITVYDRFRADASWKAFFAEMESLRDRKLRESGSTFDVLAADYPFLRLGDLISLAFCTGSTQEQHFAGWSVALVDSRVGVTPDAFGAEQVAFEISAREIPRSSFATDAGLRESLRAARTVVLRGRVGALRS